MAKVLVTESYLDDIAEAIRGKNGSTTNYKPREMASAIINLETAAEPVLQSKSVSPSLSEQTITPDENYDGLSSVKVSAMPTASQAIPQISINSSTGLITATATQSAGYVEADTKSSTSQLTTKGETTISPSSQEQYIDAGTYLTGLITIEALNDGNNLTYGTTTSVTDVLVAKTKLDALATTIKQKASSLTLPATLTAMQTAIASIKTSSQISLQAKSVDPTDELQVITADSGYDALSSVQVSAVNATELSVTSNGTYTPARGSYYDRVIVNTDNQAEFNLQTKQVTPTTSPQSVTPDTGYNGLSSVTVAAIPSSYADITGVTATASDVAAGKTFIDSTGAAKTGILSVSSYYVSSDIPDSSVGEDGDLYLKI